MTDERAHNTPRSALSEVDGMDGQFRRLHGCAHTELVAAVERAAFDTFARTTNAEVVIDAQSGQLASEVRKVC